MRLNSNTFPNYLELEYKTNAMEVTVGIVCSLAFDKDCRAQKEFVFISRGGCRHKTIIFTHPTSLQSPPSILKISSFIR